MLVEKRNADKEREEKSKKKFEREQLVKDKEIDRLSRALASAREGALSWGRVKTHAV